MEEVSAKPTDTEINATWQSMLQMFHKIIENNPTPEKVKEKLVELQDLAKNSGIMTVRQVEGIYMRCQNYLDGTWGMNSKREAYMASVK
jgi:hypothetical protein